MLNAFVSLEVVETEAQQCPNPRPSINFYISYTNSEFDISRFVDIAESMLRKGIPFM